MVTLIIEVRQIGQWNVEAKLSEQELTQSKGKHVVKLYKDTHKIKLIILFMLNPRPHDGTVWIIRT